MEPHRVRQLIDVFVYLIRVCAVLVLGPVRGVRKGLVAAFMFAHIWLLPSVGPEVGLEVLQARICFGAALKLQRDRNRQRMRKGDCLGALLFCRQLGREKSWATTKKSSACFTFHM